MSKKNRALTISSESIPTTAKSVKWNSKNSSELAFTLANSIKNSQQTLVIVTENMQQAEELQKNLQFFDTTALIFSDTEMLPYDSFSPQSNTISERLSVLSAIYKKQANLVIVTIPTLMQRIAPVAFLETQVLSLKQNDIIDRDSWRLSLESNGYRHVKQVMESGEFAIRGAIIDLYPMGYESPIRIDCFDNEIDSIRTFDPETQITVKNIKELSILPAKEFDTSEKGIALFKDKFKQTFEIDTTKSKIYQSVSEGNFPSGIENYLPLFFEETATFFDYLPNNSTFIIYPEILKSGESFQALIDTRYDRYRHDIEKPLVSPSRLYLTIKSIHEILQNKALITLEKTERLPPIVNFEQIKEWLNDNHQPLILVAETAGRREITLDKLNALDLRPKIIENFSEMIKNPEPFSLMCGELNEGFDYKDIFTVITENEILGIGKRIQRKQKKAAVDIKSMLTNIDHLEIDDPIVHLKYGVGRYAGLEKIDDNELLAIEYKDNAKLYIPVTDLHNLSLYTGGAKELAPWHKLGTEQWSRVCKKATEKLHDTAAELLDIYSKRELQEAKGMFIPEEYQDFCNTFPFQTTFDQQKAIDEVLADLKIGKMDRIICGDVGFGKTEVAMRAAFVTVMNGYQVAILAPTTLLAEQHANNFIDRFSTFPIKISALSRFNSTKEIKKSIEQLNDGKLDIVIGTHKLLSKDVQFKNLGLIIIDEEHRFGVKQKERFKALRAEVNLLTMTATPIPRTLNLGLSGLRALSIIATPPVDRLATKTLVNEWNDEIIIEAVNREIKRGGQIYFLHNEVHTINYMQENLANLFPSLTIKIAHGQMNESELEQVMLDFKHHHADILLCTTIVESGIDIPNANTIIINRADKLGLAQLHQLRGRVGRSSYKAYCYLITPPHKAMTKDAVKRIEALTETDMLGAGFMLANHDLEIRGAGELLGDQQSGQITEMGFSLYMELLTRTVNALKSGKHLDINEPFAENLEIRLGLPALIPEDYINDIPTRLSFYKRIASADSKEKLDNIQIELIDRFGLLPNEAKRLFSIAEIKMAAAPLNIEKIEASNNGIKVYFGKKPQINLARMIEMIQKTPSIYQLQGQEVLHYKIPLENEILRVNSIFKLIHELKPNT